MIKNILTALGGIFILFALPLISTFLFAHYFSNPVTFFTGMELFCAIVLSLATIDLFIVFIIDVENWKINKKNSKPTMEEFFSDGK